MSDHCSQPGSRSSIPSFSTGLAARRCIARRAAASSSSSCCSCWLIHALRSRSGGFRRGRPVVRRLVPARHQVGRRPAAAAFAGGAILHFISPDGRLCLRRTLVLCVCFSLATAAAGAGGAAPDACRPAAVPATRRRLGQRTPVNQPPSPNHNGRTAMVRPMPPPPISVR